VSTAQDDIGCADELLLDWSTFSNRTTSLNGGRCSAKDKEAVIDSVKVVVDPAGVVDPTAIVDSAGVVDSTVAVDPAVVVDSTVAVDPAVVVDAPEVVDGPVVVDDGSLVDYDGALVVVDAEVVVETADKNEEISDKKSCDTKKDEGEEKLWAGLRRSCDQYRHLLLTRYQLLHGSISLHDQLDQVIHAYAFTRWHSLDSFDLVIVHKHSLDGTIALSRILSLINFFYIHSLDGSIV